MDLLGEIHQSGITILVVTHDPEVASRTERTIRLRDGKVVGADEPRLSNPHLPWSPPRSPWPDVLDRPLAGGFRHDPPQQAADHPDLHQRRVGHLRAGVPARARARAQQRHAGELRPRRHQRRLGLLQQDQHPARRVRRRSPDLVREPRLRAGQEDRGHRPHLGPALHRWPALGRARHQARREGQQLRGQRGPRRRDPPRGARDHPGPVPVRVRHLQPAQVGRRRATGRRVPVRTQGEPDRRVDRDRRAPVPDHRCVQRSGRPGGGAPDVHPGSTAQLAFSGRQARHVQFTLGDAGRSRPEDHRQGGRPAGQRHEFSPRTSRRCGCRTTSSSSAGSRCCSG